MKKTLKRNVLKQVQAAWEGNSIRTNDNFTKQKNAPIYQRAYSSVQIFAGDPVRIVGWYKSITFDKARELLLSNAILFSVDKSFSLASSDNVGIAVDTIRPSRVGRVKIDNLCWGIVTETNSTHLYANEQLVSTAEPSIYRILAKSQISNGKRVCSLVKRSGDSGGGGGTSGTTITLRYIDNFEIQDGVLIATYKSSNVLKGAD